MTPKNILNITKRADFREWLVMNTGYTGWDVEALELSCRKIISK